MNLIDKEVTHTIFGEGLVVGHDESFITIDFDNDVKKFVYPDAFGDFITLKDKEAAKSLETVITKIKIEEKALNKKREEEREQRMADQERRELLKNHKIHESSQIVFWLDEEEQQNIFTDWQIFTGEVQSGDRKGQPNRVPRLSPNSASLLTVRDEDEPEEKRQIRGIYMVSETFSGDLSDDGIVPAHEEFRIELSEKESEQMLFWDFYTNNNNSARAVWNSGKYRYYDNIWTAQILTAIKTLKKDEEEIAKVQKFLEYFCQVNAIDIDDIPEPNGALKQ